MTSAEASARLDAELSLLEAMYPGSITFNPQSRDLRHVPSGSQGSALILRLPDRYPEQGCPEVMSACDDFKNDLRDRVRRAMHALGAGETGVEVLDQVIGIFESLISEAPSDLTAGSIEEPKGKDQQATGGQRAPSSSSSSSSPPRSRTVIIWLHHLLATSKRKLAVNPTAVTRPPTAAASPPASTPSNAISGIVKPGYPGIMVFSGPNNLVDSHVREPKALNWQAFQVRYDSGETVGQEEQEGDEWGFSHDKGKIIEVESMAEVVKGIAKEEHKQLFLKAVGVK